MSEGSRRGMPAQTKGEDMRHGIVCILAVMLTCACQPNAGAKGSPATAAPAGQPSSSAAPKSGNQVGQPMTKRELSKIVGATCDDPDSGYRCFGGDYDIELLPDCGDFAGVIAPKGALLIDKAPPDDSVRLAVLSRGQLVCIQAIARAGASASYYYVVALADPTPGTFGERKIEWLAPRQENPCRMVSKGRFEGSCAAGWTDEVGVSVLPNKS
jgi:hypothetical protein